MLELIQTKRRKRVGTAEKETDVFGVRIRDAQECVAYIQAQVIVIQCIQPAEQAHGLRCFSAGFFRVRHSDPLQ